MDNLDPSIAVPGATPAPATPAPVVVPDAGVPPVQPAVPVGVPPTPPQFAGGGVAGGKFFDGITLTDVIVGSAVITALALAIYYYRERIKHAKAEYPNLRIDVESVKNRLDEIQNPENQSQFG